MRKFLVRSSEFGVSSFKAFLFFVLFLLLPATNYQLLTTYAQQATLSLSPSTGTFNKGCSFALQIVLNTGSAQTDGTDVIIFYDPTRFSAQSVVSGSIYPDYPGNNIDDTAGKITISGLASVTTPFTGQGVLATVNFKVQDNAQTGLSQIKFDFDPNDKSKTTDSNVVERGTVADILNSVVNGNYTVGTGSCPSSKPIGGTGGIGGATPSATPVNQPQPTLPPGGTPETTYAFALVGGVLVLAGILGLVLL